MTSTSSSAAELQEEIRRLKYRAAELNVHIGQWMRVDDNQQVRRLQNVRNEYLLKARLKEAELKRLLETCEP
jgi:hypothetical protein